MKKIIQLSICALICLFSYVICAEDAADMVTRSKPCNTCPPKDTCCTRLQCRTLLACAATPINCATGQTQIRLDTSGSYCLTGDISCNIVLAASGITLDLNGHAVNGIISTENNSSLKNLIIKNGIITVPNGMNGITIRGTDEEHSAENCIIEDIVIYCNSNCQADPVTGGTRGVFIEFAQAIDLSRLYVNGAVLANVEIESSAQVTMQDSDFVLSCSVGGIIGNNSFVTGLIIDNCTFTNNRWSGLELGATESVPTQEGRISNCIFAHNNIGFYFDATALAFVMNNCQTTANNYGFFVNSSGLGISFIDCIAQEDISAGFVASGAVAVLFDNCIAQGTGLDSGIGFDIAIDASNIELRNALANAFVIGFSIDDTAQNILLTACIASNNAVYGFFVGAETGDVIMQQCTAVNNNSESSSTGFFDAADNSSTNTYVSCFAAKNGTDDYYPDMGLPFNPVDVTATPGYWANVFA